MGLNWKPSATYLAETTHVLGSICIMLAAHIQDLSTGWTAIGILLVAGIKEFWVDRTWLEQDSLAGSTLDFAMYGVGVGLAWLSFHLFFMAAVLTGLVILGMVAIDIDAPEMWPK